jgi:plastocyanin
VSKRLLFGLIPLVLVAVACAPPPPPTFPLASGQFLPQAVDFLSDTGRSPSIAVDSDGLPHLAYLGLNQKLKKGEIPPARPVTLPMIPAVLTATLTKSGVWNYGDVIATEDQAKPLKLTAKDEVALAVDTSGNGHVAFTEEGVLKYAVQSGGSYGTPEKIATGKVVGLSIAVDSKGTPWVSWLSGNRLEAAAKQGKTWKVQDVTKISNQASTSARTSIKAGPKGPVIAYSSGTTPTLATQSGKGWSTEKIQPGGGGLGISLALDSGGVPTVAYYTTSGDVRLAQSNGASWKVGTLGRAGRSNASGWSASVAVDKKGTPYVAWYDGKGDDVRMASGSGGSLKPIPITGTQNGELPQVAVASDGSVVYVAWYDHLNLDLDMGTYGVTEKPPIALAVPTPTTAASPTAVQAQCKPTGSTIKVVASGIAFDTNCLAATASKPFTIDFDNKDAGVPHNVEVYDTQGGKRLFGATSATDTITGPATTTYKVTPQKPGTYYFQCDIHPTQMNGTFYVK